MDGIGWDGMGLDGGLDGGLDETEWRDVHKKRKNENKM